jgi:hypothetical protein
MARLSEQLREKFGDHIAASSGDPDICRLQGPDSIPQMAAFMRQSGARLVTVFAEDRTRDPSLNPRRPRSPLPRPSPRPRPNPRLNPSLPSPCLKPCRPILAKSKA